MAPSGGAGLRTTSVVPNLAHSTYGPAQHPRKFRCSNSEALALKLKHRKEHRRKTPSLKESHWSKRSSAVEEPEESARRESYAKSEVLSELAALDDDAADYQAFLQELKEARGSYAWPPSEARSSTLVLPDLEDDEPYARKNAEVRGSKAWTAFSLRKQSNDSSCSTTPERSDEEPSQRDASLAARRCFEVAALSEERSSQQDSSTEDSDVLLSELRPEKLPAPEYFVREGYDDCMACLDELIAVKSMPKARTRTSIMHKQRKSTLKLPSKRFSSLMEQLSESIGDRRSSTGTDDSESKRMSADSGGHRFTLLGGRSSQVLSSLNARPKVVMPWKRRSTLEAETEEDGSGAGSTLGRPGQSHVEILEQLAADTQCEESTDKRDSRRATGSVLNTLRSRINSVVSGTDSRRKSTAPTAADRRKSADHRTDRSKSVVSSGGRASLEMSNPGEQNNVLECYGVASDEPAEGELSALQKTLNARFQRAPERRRGMFAAGLLQSAKMQSAADKVNTQRRLSEVDENILEIFAAHGLT
jgi:hypothetical protein